jgi:hypothetical protein
MEKRLAAPLDSSLGLRSVHLLAPLTALQTVPLLGPVSVHSMAPTLGLQKALSASQWVRLLLVQPWGEWMG